VLPDSVIAVDGTGSGSCPMAGSGIIDVETVGYFTENNLLILQHLFVS
jgi:hypothetical protein